MVLIKDNLHCTTSHLHRIKLRWIQQKCWSPVSRAVGGRDNCVVFPHWLLEPLIPALYVFSAVCPVLNSPCLTMAQDSPVHILCFLEHVTLVCVNIQPLCVCVCICALASSVPYVKLLPVSLWIQISIWLHLLFLFKDDCSYKKYETKKAKVSSKFSITSNKIYLFRKISAKPELLKW